ncbi:MAG: putative metal-binding motif-containing protein [Deltaproteobacteria bacterium]|nr:putative metal-binding motif-containing protein [Deltaproteobacteria bacterium]
MRTLAGLTALLLILSACRAAGTDPTLTDGDGDGTPVELDCDDTNPAVHPGALERCDGVDNDCDEAVDEDPVDGLTWYEDHDGDGFGDPASPVRACEQPEGAVLSSADCDDARGLIHPGAAEFCNDTDDDCDHAIDEDPLDGSEWFPDRDGDGYGDPLGSRMACEAPEGYVDNAEDCADNREDIHPDATETDPNDPTDYNCDGAVAWEDRDGDGSPVWADCDDADASLHPGALERCDGVDNDCNERIDDDAVDAVLYFEDFDRDGYGDGDVTLRACEPPDGYAVTAGDCDDLSPTTHPFADELCDGADNDCDGTADDNASDARTWYADLDGDGVAGDRVVLTACGAPAGYLLEAGDCDDLRADAHPGAVERCNGRDDDCDGTVDEEAADAPLWYLDGDEDGYGEAGSGVRACAPPAGTVADGSDCDDTDPAIAPAPLWFRDRDGDGHGDAERPAAACEAPAGYVDLSDDCDDNRPSVAPGQDERCDGLDNDCDGTTDEEVADAPTWYIDADGDGFGDDATATTACVSPAGAVSAHGDCDDGDAGSSPVSPERCDGLDNDCDGAADEDALDATAWFADADGDGFGDGADALRQCEAPAGRVANDMDCDDTSASRSPATAERCDGLDNDCDGTADEDALDATTWFADADGDGFGATSSGLRQCSAPAGYTSLSGDCDDGAPLAWSGAAELCDGVDNNCDGVTDSDAVDRRAWYGDADGDGYGDPTAPSLACAAPAGTSPLPLDCDDGEPLAWSGAAEVCDGVDNDCDGDADGEALDAPTWFADDDDDDHGDPDTSLAVCVQPAGYVADASDCDDAQAAAWTGAPERCDGVDNNCDGRVDEGFLGSAAACPAPSCLAILQDASESPYGYGVGSGSYWLDPEGDGSPASYLCDMTTAGGGWTQLIDWDATAGDTATDLTDQIPLDWNTMGYDRDDGSYLRWCDYDGSYDVRDYHLQITVPNLGETRTDIYLYGASMEESANYLYVTNAAGSTDHDIACEDLISGAAYTAGELAYRPGYSCPNSTTTYTWNATWQDDFGEPIGDLHLSSFHGDANCGDYTRLYRLNFWVR